MRTQERMLDERLDAVERNVAELAKGGELSAKGGIALGEAVAELQRGLGSALKSLGWITKQIADLEYKVGALMAMIMPEAPGSGNGTSKSS